MAKLSTHVLDTAQGCPGKGIQVVLYFVSDGQRKKVAADVTNNDGRTAEPLLEGDVLKPGTYELEFRLGPYFKVPTGSFLDVAIVRFNVEAGQNYHVPLLASPYGYTTYRGS